MKQREIKLRLWHYGLKKWIDGEDLSVHGDGRVTVFHSGEFEPEIDPEGIIVQNTGLKDKNGREIYEGDIIRKSYGPWGVIVYEPPFFQVTVSADQSSLYTKEWIMDSEVIGNIYENPDLLK